jgi:hypothetical protein
MRRQRGNDYGVYDGNLGANRYANRGWQNNAYTDRISECRAPVKAVLIAMTCSTRRKIGGKHVDLRCTQSNVGTTYSDTTLKVAYECDEANAITGLIRVRSARYLNSCKIKVRVIVLENIAF